MKTVCIKSALASSLAALAMGGAAPASAMDILARVVASTPVVQQVAVPRQVCNNQQIITQAPKSGAGALMGAVAGGALGNSVGGGNGRTAATLLGLFGGAVLGDNIEGSNPQLQNVQQCNTQTFYENRTSHYHVEYEYQGTRYTTQMANDPGGYVRLQVSPVGALSPAGAPAPASPGRQAYPSPPTFQPVPVAPPVVYYRTQTQTISPPVYVQPAAAPVYVPRAYDAPPYDAPSYQAPTYYAPAYYPPSYYRPSYHAPSAPVGLSLNFGYSRSYGGGHRHGHWR